MRKVFVEAGLATLKRTRLVCAPLDRSNPRHFAGCAESADRIYVVPEITSLPDETLVAILSHEFGHAADFAYPAHWVLVEGELLEQVSVGEGREAYNRRMQWEARDHDSVERAADAIAEWAYRIAGSPKRIAYAGPCLLQTFGMGARPRPAGLG